MNARGPLEWCGRVLKAEELSLAVEMVGMCGGLPRKELARTVCEHLGWVTVTGRYKVSACLTLLEALERTGRLKLPVKRMYAVREKREREGWSSETEAGVVQGEVLEDVKPVELELVRGREGNRLWNEYVDRYHPLGYKQPHGYALRYLVVSPRGRLGCVLLSGASRAVRLRDRYIGWDRAMRQKNLPWVVNNSRYLIFPWVEVKHLASHVLGQLARRVRADYEREWGFRPVLLETFVDPLHFAGTCYKASGWTLLGSTSGEGLARPGREYETTPKLLFVKPLVEDFRELLCSNRLEGRSTDEPEEEGSEKGVRDAAAPTDKGGP